ncbi:MAG: acetyl-CoA C-acyltransferase [Phycisphaerales bacterium]|nr:MAG: acetyl-CoA C-acyltransferase [Phycisphaerales bacterium]
METSVIVAAKRSPVGKYLGSLSRVSAPELGTRVAKAVLDETDAISKGVDEVFVGCVLQAGLGQNPARQIALGAGIGDYITAVTLNKVCGSGLEAVMQADRGIRCGDIHVALAGGIESMSLAPYYMQGVRTGLKFGDGKLIDGMQFDGLTCAFEHWAMGCAAEHTAKSNGVTRRMQDEFAVNSHRKASAAQKAGLFKKEIVPIEQRKGAVSEDETVRHDASLEGVGRLPPVFEKDGTVTAANASALSDGAAMTLVASSSAAKKHGWRVRAEILATATAGVAPKDLFMAPVHAVRAVVEKAGLTLGDIDLFELNEAFAAQSVADIKVLEIPEDKVNVHGGAIALGHPIGASGTRILVTLIHAMEERKAKNGVACLCLGGGNAVAVCIRR